MHTRTDFSAPDIGFVRLQVTSAATDKPKPVYKFAACCLGIHKTAGTEQ